MKCSIIALTMVLFAPGALAAATVETFESYPVDTVLTTQIPGLTISADTANATVRRATNPVVPDEPKGLAHYPYFDFPDYLHVDFAPRTTTVGAIIDFGNVGAGVRLTAYSGLGQTGQILGTDSTTIEEFISVTADGIRSARFESLGNDATYLIDNLTYQLIPEPTALADLGIGAFVLLAQRWRQLPASYRARLGQ